MENKTLKEITRRDAIKVLAAVAGAAALANIPDKWTKPGMEVGVLPAHAQTSNPAPYTLAAGADDPQCNFCQDITSTGTVTPLAVGMLLHYVISLPPGVTIKYPPSANAPANAAGALPVVISLEGDVPTDSSGVARIVFRVNSAFSVDDLITVTWSFVNPSDGTNTDMQTFTSGGSGC